MVDLLVSFKSEGHDIVSYSQHECVHLDIEHNLIIIGIRLCGYKLIKLKLN